MSLMAPACMLYALSPRPNKALRRSTLVSRPSAPATSFRFPLFTVIQPPLAVCPVNSVVVLSRFAAAPLLSSGQ